jgi:hypothetical protein
MEGEPLLWYNRFTRFRLMFPRRSVAAVFHGEQSSRNPEKPRRNPDNDWYNAAKRWQWEERAEAYDAAQFAEEEKIRARVMRSGFALQHNRILALQKQLEDLIAMTAEQDKVWVPDVKAIGNGPDAERVDLVQFNDALFKEVREYLTDIAEEMGERVKKQITTHRGLSKMYVDLNDNEDGCEP